MSSAARYLDDLLRSQADREQLRPYLEQAKKLQSECGCALSGAFASIALIVAVTVVGIIQRGAIESPTRTLCVTLVATLVAGLIGKLSGIAIARIRMRLLHRTLRRQFAPSRR